MVNWLGRVSTMHVPAPVSVMDMTLMNMSLSGTLSQLSPPWRPLYVILPSSVAHVKVKVMLYETPMTRSSPHAIQLANNS